MTPETVWRSLSHGERVRRLAESYLRLGEGSLSSILDDARNAAYRDAMRDARVIDRCVEALDERDPHGISSEALR